MIKRAEVTRKMIDCYKIKHDCTEDTAIKALKAQIEIGYECDCENKFDKEEKVAEKATKELKIDTKTKLDPELKEILEDAADGRVKKVTKEKINKRLNK